MKRKTQKKRAANFYNMKFVRKDGVLTQYNGSDEDIIIPADVTNIGDAPFRQNPQLKRVIIHNSVKTIGEGAFRDCHNLTSIEMPGYAHY